MTRQVEVRAVGVMSRDAYRDRIPATETFGQAETTESFNTGRASADNDPHLGDRYGAGRREVIGRCV